jgi:hypothetical protein
MGRVGEAGVDIVSATGSDFGRRDCLASVPHLDDGVGLDGLGLVQAVVGSEGGGWSFDRLKATSEIRAIISAGN